MRNLLALCLPILLGWSLVSGCSTTAEQPDGSRPNGGLGPTCADGAKNGMETGVDCGGNCPVCSALATPCSGDGECSGGTCKDGQCQPPSSSCSDQILNGNETSLDCGGTHCPPCALHLRCVQNADCQSGRCVDSECNQNWPFGNDGDLVVASGMTHVVSAGSTLDFKNLTIEAGAVLKISGGVGWTQIGVAETLTLAGKIDGSTAEFAAEAISATAAFEDGLPLGEKLVWTMKQPKGGNGQGSPGNPEAFGNGGGGDGGLYCEKLCDLCSNGRQGEAAVNEKAGDGGLGFLGNGTPGVGGSTFGEAGTDGANAGGGGGGFRGYHGQTLYLHVTGSVIGGGTIDLRGTSGGDGGSGLATGVGEECGAVCFTTDRGGEGGGGGAGGNGGVLVWRGVPLPPAISVFFAAGKGGKGGRTRPACQNWFAGSGEDGAPGCVNIKPGLPLECL